MPPEPPPYPPDRVWSFPPPPIGRHWLWAAIVVVVASSVLVVGLIATVVVLETDDAPGLIDSGRVLDKISDECDTMTATVEQLSSGNRSADLPDMIRQQNDAVTLMVKQIRSLPSEVLTADRPTEAWLRDWDRLIAARESYAKALEADGRSATSFEIPRDSDGAPIATRMEEALFNEECLVPETLTDPDRRSTSSI